MADYGKQIGRLSIRVLPNASRFRADLTKLIKRIENSMAVNLEVRASTIRAHQQVKRFVDEFDGKDLAMGVDVNTAAARAQIAALSRPRVMSLAVRVREASITKAQNLLKGLSGIRVAADLLDKLNEGLGRLDQSVGKIGRVAMAIANLGAVLAVAAAGTVTVAGDLVKIGNLGLVLPAAFAGAATGILTLVVALRTAKQELAPLAPAMNELAGIMQSGFWGEARQPILDLVTSLLPSLRTGFGATAEAIGRQMGTLAGELQRTLGGGVIDGMFQKLVETIDVVTTGMRPLAEAFTTLGAVGSTYLPRLATYLVDVGNKFNDWVQASAESGELFTFIEEGITAAKDFGRAIGGLVGILRGIDSAATAAGGGGLSAFADNVQGAAKIIQSPGVQSALTTILEGANRAVAGLGVGMSALGQMLMANAPTIESVLGIAGEAVGKLVAAIADALATPEFQTGLLNLFTGLSTGMSALGPAMGPLAALFGMLGTTVGMLAAQFGPLLATLKIEFAPVLETILGVVQPLIPLFGTALRGAIQGVAPIVQQLASFIRDNEGAFTVLAGVLVTTVPAIAGIGRGLTVLKGAMTAAQLSNLALGASFLKGLPAMAKSAAQTLILKTMYGVDMVKAIGLKIAALARSAAAWTANTARMVASKVALAATAAATKTAAAAQAIMNSALVKNSAAWVANAARMVASKAVMLAVSVATKAAAAAQWLMNAAMSANPIGLIIAAIAALVAGLVWFFTQTDAGRAIWAGFMQFLQEAWTNIVNVATTIWEGLVSIVTDVWNNIVSFVETAAKLIYTVVQVYIGMVVSFWTGVWNGIVAVVTTVWNAIVLAVQVAVQFVLTVVTTYINMVVSFWTAVWNGIVLVVSTVWNAIVLAVQVAVQFVLTVITTYINMVVSFWTGVWNTIVAVVTTVWNAITSAVSSAVTAVQTVIVNIVTAVKTWWDNTWNAIRAAILTVWSAILAAVRTAITAVQTTIADIMGRVKATWESIWNAVKDAVSKAVDGVKKFVQGMIDAVKEKVQAVSDTVTGVKDGIVNFFAGAGKWLSDAGKAIIQGLIDGISSMLQGAKDAVSGVMDGISAFLPHSPAKEGPFSGRGWTPYSGRALVEGLAEGMESRIARVKSVADEMMTAASGTARFDIAGTTTSLERARAEQLAAEAGTHLTVQGNVGYDPKEIVDEMQLKKQQAQMSAQLGLVTI